MMQQPSTDCESAGTFANGKKSIELPQFPLSSKAKQTNANDERDANNSPTLSPVSLDSGRQEPSEDGVAQQYPVVGRLRSWRGALVLSVTCGAQLMDDIFITSGNMALPSIQKDLDVAGASLQWLISAYVLTFGGLLLLSGVLADRHGRKNVFCVGMAMLTIWTLANGFATTFIQLAIFRALQGIGAAMTVPSAVGIISNYFVAQDRTLALTLFGAAGSFGFCVGLLIGGFLTSSLGWRYIFYIPAAITGVIGILGWLILPPDSRDGMKRPKLDALGALLSTSALILLSFVLSSGGVYGWGKAFIIVLLILSVAMICAFTWLEAKVSDPIMPLSLWRLKNFAPTWVSGFAMYGSYQAIVYYTTLIAQDVNHLSAGETALRFLPMGATSLVCCLFMSRLLETFSAKWLLIGGLGLCVAAPIPSALIKTGDIDSWKHVFPSTIMGIAGPSIVYCTITVVLLASVPVNIKSLCGGMVNTAFQIGGGVGLALSSAVVQAAETKRGHGLLEQYRTGMWCCSGLAGVGLIVSLLFVRSAGEQSLAH